MKRIAIVSAWEPELTYLHQHFPSHRVEKRAAWEFHFHSINELEIISVITGVGKVNCASCVQLLISEFKPEQLFMTGICGSLSEKVKNGHIVVALNTLQHDVTAAGTGTDSFDLYTGRAAPIETTKYLVRQIKKVRAYDPVHFGTFISGDQRIRSTEMRYLLHTVYGAIAVDQEIAAFAYVCHVNKKPFLCLKAASDQANDKTVEEQKVFKMLACERACEYLIAFLRVYELTTSHQ
ncbi:5'-methylthioadenosine/S-adenosylhomocysteine nucleosidase [Bacillus pseudomycoides]|uniref:5'-methylthioadenosine/S-adenosylhomocysteine nucleosidase n=1 Tax=Bacillus pseudomycoides TaxID=64104 RepID=UPI000BF69EB5|nr:5'-methylthioadenosine/S-adenosylhomocysteine nucleosidase [Bacillus pseudomycoides]PGC32646.1 5'-methylthioadenosine/S-adenosylhomocysteine nucleosidase [Bacillus pseudomycoides]